MIYGIKFIDNFRFMSTSLSNLVDNLSKGIHKNGKCDNCSSNLEYISRRKSGKLVFKCIKCERNTL